MLTSVKKTVKTVAIVVTVSGLSACANLPQVDMNGITNTVGDTVATVSQKSREFGSKAYQSTRRFLGYDREVAPRDGDLLDEVDLALMEEDAAPATDDSGVNVIIQPVAVAEANELEPLATEPLIPEQPIEPAAEQVAIAEYVHEVQPGESLWTIAKLTTGDATNWQILAEYNDMPDGKSVYPTQQLVVPADMVKPELASLNFIEKAPESGLATDNADSGRLQIPDTDIVAAAPTSDPIPAESIEKIDSSADAIAVTVEAGETLWDLAKRTTGDATNWKSIATHNNFTEEEAVFVRYGQTIYIPEALAKDEVLAQAAPEPKSIAAEEEEVVAVAATQPDLPKANGVETTEVADATPVLEKTEAVAVSANAITDSSLFDETKPIKIVEATYQSDETLPLPTEETPADSTGVQMVMVSGTYYPKAIYHEADFSSSLLQRVSPGTKLVVSRAMGSWYEVKTDQGIGYMHARDIK
ncbi:MAG: LysM peptidoglycan-binding domain-containing protein [Gammaproteobacteria bacterium]|nr:LysM peptidoglycan-binding domain-containing protein [Gammaproteobacteria bacterium]